MLLNNWKPVSSNYQPPNHTIKKKAIIVSSRNPSNDTSVQRAKAMFKKKYGVELIPKNIQIEITIK